MHVLLFDIDGTLLNTGGAGQKAMEAALRLEYNATRPVERIPFAGRTDRAITTDLFAFYGLTLDEREILRFQEAYLRHLPLHLEASPGCVLPGIAELIPALARRDDVVLGLLTGNFRRGAAMKLSHYGLHEYFVAGGYGDDHHDRDDVARAAVGAVEQHLGTAVSRDRVWVIGDTPWDVRCGRAIGAKVVAVCTGHYSSQELSGAHPDYLFENFANPAGLADLFI